MCLRGQTDGIGERVLGVALRGCGEGDDLCLRQAIQRADLRDAWPPERQGARLVDQDHVGAGECLEVPPALDQEPTPCAGAYGSQHRHWSRQRKGARAGDHEDRGGGEHVVADEEGEPGDGHHHRKIVGGEAVGPALHLGSVRLGLLDHPHNATEGRVRTDVDRADAQAAQAGEGGREDPRARPGLGRHRLPGDRRLVHRGMASDHLAVNGNLLAGADDDRLADAHLGERHLDLPAGARDASRLGRHRREALDGAAGPVGREALGEVADAHEEDNDHRRGPLAQYERGQHAHGHQRVRGDAPAQGSAEDAPEHRVAAEQHETEACRPGHPLRVRLEEPQPLAQDHDEEHGAEDDGEERQDARREATERTGWPGGRDSAAFVPFSTAGGLAWRLRLLPRSLL